MSVLIDQEYVNVISYQLQGFSWIRPRLGLARCAICGDSKKSQHKRRFYIYQPTDGGVKDYLSVSCKNCGYGNTFYRFLEEFNSQVHQEYKMALFRELGIERKPVVEKKEEIDWSVPITSLDGCRSILALEPLHPARLYLAKRGFHTRHMERLWYTDNFHALANSFCEDNEFDIPVEPRIVTPFIDRNGYITCIQGREYRNPNTKMRYITIKRNESSSKIFGLDRLDVNKPVYVLEGPYDSLFVPNCLAVGDANLMAANVQNAILIPDAQPRNKELCKTIEKMINFNQTVCLLPDNLPGKDINAWIQNGITESEVLQIIQKHTYSGLRLKMEWSKWKKC